MAKYVLQATSVFLVFVFVGDVFSFVIYNPTKPPSEPVAPIANEIELRKALEQIPKDSFGTLTDVMRLSNIRPLPRSVATSLSWNSDKARESKLRELSQSDIETMFITEIEKPCAQIGQVGEQYGQTIAQLARRNPHGIGLDRVIVDMEDFADICEAIEQNREDIVSNLSSLFNELDQ